MLVDKSLAIAGNPGKYMSIAKGLIVHNDPKIRIRVKYSERFMSQKAAFNKNKKARMGHPQFLVYAKKRTVLCSVIDNGEFICCGNNFYHGLIFRGYDICSLSSKRCLLRYHRIFKTYYFLYLTLSEI